MARRFLCCSPFVPYFSVIVIQPSFVKLIFFLNQFCTSQGIADLAQRSMLGWMLGTALWHLTFVLYGAPIVE